MKIISIGLLAFFLLSCDNAEFNPPPAEILYCSVTVEKDVNNLDVTTISCPDGSTVILPTTVINTTEVIEVIIETQKKCGKGPK